MTFGLISRTALCSIYLIDKVKSQNLLFKDLENRFFFKIEFIHVVVALVTQWLEH